MAADPFVSLAQWRFYNPVRIFVGRGCRAELMEQVQGKNLLLVTSQRGRLQLLADPLLGDLAKKCKLHWVDTVTENPALIELQDCVNRLTGIYFDAVIGFGGGSALDTAKVLRLALSPTCQHHSVAELIENPGLHPINISIPLYALPTTSGTGSEVTPFATVWNQAEMKKLSLSSLTIFPTAAYVDADLTDSLPIHVSISTGLDAINQAAESIWNKNATPITLAYATRAIKMGFSALPRIAQGETKSELRNQMAESSLLAGLAISHTRTALCHSISYPLTAYFGIPHGLACAFTMSSVLKFNLVADDGRFGQLAQQWLGTSDTDELINEFDNLENLLQIRIGVKERIPSLKELLSLKEEMFTLGRSDNNLRKVDDIEDLLINAWG